MNDNSQDEEEKDDLMSWTNFSSFLNEGDNNTSKYLNDSSSHYTNNNIILTSTSLGNSSSSSSSSNNSNSSTMQSNNGFYNNSNNNEEQQLQPSTSNLLQFPISMEQLQQLKQKEQPPPQKITLKSIEQLKLQLQQNNQIQFEAQPVQKHTFQYQSKNIKSNNTTTTTNNNNSNNNNGGEKQNEEKPLPSPPSQSPPLPKIPTLGKDLIVKLKQMNLPFSASSVYKITTVPKTNGTGFKNKYDPYDPVSIAELTKVESFNPVSYNNNNINHVDASTILTSPFPVKVEFNEVVHMDTTNYGYLHQNEEEHVDLITSDITDSNYNNSNNYYYGDGTYGHQHQQMMDVGQTNTVHHHYQENSEFDEICKKIGRKLLDSGKVYCPHCFDVFDHQIQLASHEILGCNNNNNNNNNSFESDVIHHVDQGQRSYSPIVAKPKSFATKRTNAIVMPKIIATSSRNNDILSLAKTRHKIPSTLSIVPTKATQPKVKAPPPSKPVVTIQPKIQPKIQAKGGGGGGVQLKGRVQPKGRVQTIVPSASRTSVRGPRGPYRKRENTRIQLRTRKNRNVRGGFYICPFFPCPEKFSNKEMFHGHLRDCHLPVFAPGQAIICPLCHSNPEPASFTLIFDWVSHISGQHSGHKKILPGPAIKYRRRDRRRQKYQVQVQPVPTPTINEDPLRLDAITKLQAPIPPTTIQLNRNITLTAIPSQPLQHPQQHQLQNRQQQQLQNRQQQQQQLQQLQNRQQQQIATKTIQIKVPNTFKGGRQQQQKRKKKDSRDVTPRRLFSCPFTPCPNNFFGSSKLFDSHLKNFHAKGKPYACTLCPMGKEFTTLFDYIIHIRMKHVHVEEQKFQTKTSISSASGSSGNLKTSTNNNNTNSGRIPALIPISRPGLVITEKY